MKHLRCQKKLIWKTKEKQIPVNLTANSHMTKVKQHQEIIMSMKPRDPDTMEERMAKNQITTEVGPMPQKVVLIIQKRERREAGITIQLENMEIGCKRCQMGTLKQERERQEQLRETDMIQEPIEEDEVEAIVEIGGKIENRPEAPQRELALFHVGIGITILEKLEMKKVQNMQRKNKLQITIRARKRTNWRRYQEDPT